MYNYRSYIQYNIDNEKAKTHFTKAVTLTPDNAQYNYNLAIYLTSKENNHKQALIYTKKAIKLNPNDYRFYHLLGNILQSIGHNSEAEPYFLKAENLAIEQQLQQQQNSNTDTNTNNANISNNKQHITLDRIATLSKVSIGQTVEQEVDGEVYTMTCLSQRPLVFKVYNMLSSTDCEHIINRSIPLLERSYVMGKSATTTTATTDTDISGESLSLTEDTTKLANTKSSGASSGSSYRDSYSTWLGPDQVTRPLQQRIAALTGLPLPYILQKAEDLQVCISVY